MKAIKENIGAILVLLFELVIGIVLFVKADVTTAVIIIALGALLVIAGLFEVFKYFRAEPLEASKQQLLVKGLCMALLGGAALIAFRWLMANITAVAYLYGGLVLLTSIVKVQWTMDALRLKKNRWFLAAICAVVSLILEIVVLVNPFKENLAGLNIFIGVGLIVAAVADLTVLIFRLIPAKAPAVEAAPSAE